MTQPGYGPFDPYGRRLPHPSPTARKNLLPWVVLAAAAVVSGLGVLFVVLLHPPATIGTATAGTSPSTSSSAAATTGAPAGGAPGGGEVADRSSGGRARFPGSARVALSWVRAMADGDVRTAYDLSCAQVRRSATDAVAGGDPAQALGGYFFQKTLGGRRIGGGTFDSIIYNQDAASDIASFTLRLDDGEEFLLLVYVQGDGTVCDFV